MELKQILKKALDEGWAVPHFNISDLVTLRAICEAAKELGSPLLVGTSEGERKFIGVDHSVSLIESYRKEYNIPIFLNADHHKSVESAKEAIDAGYDSVNIDLSKELFEDNLKGTREVVEYAHLKNDNISVEGELGYLVTDSSKVYKEVVDIPPESLTKPEEAEKFVKETRVDRFTPAVGNLHGIAANEPKLDLERVEAIHGALEGISMVLHGGSGIPDEQIQAAIKKGMNNVHVNTELRIAYHEAIKKFIAENPDEATPYKFLAPAVEAIKQKAAEKIKLFGSLSKI
jgi:fructose-bisphosphate aldolase, class II